MEGILKTKGQFIRFLAQNQDGKKPFIIQGQHTYMLSYCDGKLKQIDARLVKKLEAERILFPFLGYSINVDLLTEKEVQGK